MKDFSGIGKHVCSFCRGLHRIDKCCSGSALEWCEYANHAAIFSRVCFDDMTFVDHILHHRNKKEVQVLGYRLGLLRLSSLQLDTIIRDIIELLSSTYPTVRIATNMLSSIPEQRYTIFASYLSSASDKAVKVMRPMMDSLYYPSRFAIKAVIMPSLLPHTTKTTKTTKTTTTKTTKRKSELISMNDSNQCSICIQDDLNTNDILTLDCSHTFCVTCYHRTLAYAASFNPVKKAHCAMCRRIPTSVLIRACALSEVEMFLDGSPIFPKKTAKDAVKNVVKANVEEELQNLDDSDDDDDDELRSLEQEEEEEADAEAEAEEEAEEEEEEEQEQERRTPQIVAQPITFASRAWSVWSLIRSRLV